MNENNEFDTVNVPEDMDEIAKVKDKRNKMWNKIQEIEKNNINKTNKETDAAMARKIYEIIKRFS